LKPLEIEINVMDIECTDRRIGDKETLIREVVAWTRRRNDQKKKINWKFTKERANKKLLQYLRKNLRIENYARATFKTAQSILFYVNLM